MKTIDGLLAEYGLKTMGNPSNSDLKRLLRFKVREFGKEFVELKLEMDGDKVPKIIMGGALINRLAFKMMIEEAQTLRIENGQTFNKRFGLYEGKATPDFLLKTLEMKFANSVFEEFVYFKRRDGVYQDMVIAEALESKAHPMHDYFIEDRLKNVFSPVEESERETLYMLLSKKIRSLIEWLEYGEGMVELKKDITLFVFHLLEEMVEEESETKSKRDIKFNSVKTI